MKRRLLAWSLWFALSLDLLAGRQSVAADEAYPRTVVDIAQRRVTIQAPPQRIYLQNGNHLTMLALLERENPFARLVAWNNSIRPSDPTLWALFEQTWPQAREIPQLRLETSGDGDLERIVWIDPDLIVLDIKMRAALEGGALGPLLERLGIAVLYVDDQSDPLANTRRSVEILGEVLGRQARAREYVDFYSEHLNALHAAIRDAPRPLVFLEVRAGRLGLDQCCYSQNRTSWAQLIEGVFARNYASDYLPGASGDIALEMLIARPPDVYFMTGTPFARETSRAIPFGYGVDEARVQAAMRKLMARPGFDRVAITRGCVIGITHQFFDSAFNIIGMEYLAKALHPQRLAGLSPQDDYRQLIARFTGLPDRPFLLAAQRGLDGTPGCPP